MIQLSELIQEIQAYYKNDERTVTWSEVLDLYIIAKLEKELSENQLTPANREYIWATMERKPFIFTLVQVQRHLE
ncbi:MAG: hypothetical protein ACXABY_06375 [Candidatus Thorarchaeota archaeon]|jgi:hypothetical protein